LLRLDSEIRNPKSEIPPPLPMLLSPYPIARSPWEVNDLFTRQRFLDPVGHRLHLFFAAVACFLAGWPTSTVEWAALPVLLCFLVRMTGRHPVLRPLWLDPCGILTFAWAIWFTLSISWSTSNPSVSAARHWLDSIQTLRYVPFILVLWPVLDRRGVLITALILGILCGQITQLGQFLQQSLHVDWFPIHRMPGRTSGWWHPVVGGSILTAALGFHLAGALLRPSSLRIGLFPVILSILTLISILATGTRGAWIASALLITIAIILRVTVRATGSPPLRRQPVRIPLVRAFLFLLVAALLLSASLSPPVRHRFSRGLSEISAALADNNYSSDTGLRIAMWEWAFAAWRTHPLTGVGAGGYQSWVRAQTPESAAQLHAPISAASHVHAHAHSWYFHTLATTGLIGAALLFSLTFLAIRSGLRGPRSFGPSRGYSAGPALALLGLCCAGLFDSITINAQTSYLFWLLIALCLPTRPRDIGPRADEGGLT
jgi:O-antigen ligase